VVTGDITLSLFKGHVRPVKRVSPFSLYHESLSSFSDSELYNQADAVGFIKIYGLPTKINGMRDRGEL
jgi:argininosuccinate synthase